MERANLKTHLVARQFLLALETRSAARPIAVMNGHQLEEDLGLQTAIEAGTETDPGAHALQEDQPAVAGLQNATETSRAAGGGACLAPEDGARGVVDRVPGASLDPLREAGDAVLGDLRARAEVVRG